MGRIFRYTIAGALGAIIAWGCMEFTALMPDDTRIVPYGYTLLIGLIAGLLIGLLLGLAEAASGLTFRDAKRAILLGAIVGAGGGMLGLAFGSAVYNAMVGFASRHDFVAFILLLIGRGVGWSLIGMFIGVSQGIATGSPQKMRNGAIGGFIGGGLGGALLEMMRWINGIPGVSIVPPLIRFISFSVTGAGIGFFIGCVEEFAKQAWLVKLVGNNEGRTIDLYTASMVIGRSEYADVPVFSDPDISERHAEIIAQGKAYAVRDLGSAFGTFVNGSKITKEYLEDGDVITVGKTKFLFRDKATARSSSSGKSYNTSVQIPTSQHICQFCGAIKDVAGNCDCTVGSGPVASPAMDPLPASQPFASQPAMTQPLNAQPLGGDVFQAAAPLAGARLVGMAGPYAGKVFGVKNGETHIGRDASKDIGLPMDTTVSRNHARIAQEVTAYVIYDSGSTNGTFVNGTKAQRKELQPGDFVQIGNSKFRFEL